MDTLQQPLPETEKNPIAESTSYDKESPPAVAASVKKWTTKIKNARKRWSDDFDRMRENMEFAAGYQWSGQTKLDEDRYIANMTLRMVNQKVATLYARDPKIAARRRRRLDFQMWDGKMETLQQAAALMASPEADEASKMEAAALIADFTQGRQQKDLVDRVGMTLEHVFSWMLGDQMPSFKVQAKQLVRRVVTTGVGYVKLDFARSGVNLMSTTDASTSMEDRIRVAQDILQRLHGGELQEDAPEVVDASALLASITDHEAASEEIEERLVFDFPMSTSIIPDQNCRALKGFIGAKWIAQEHMMTVEEVNQFFEVKINRSNEVQMYAGDNGKYTEEQGANAYQVDGESKKRVCVWQVFDLPTKSSFYICDGYCEYLQPPQPVFPETKHFWPIFALTFNDVEVEPDQQKATIFPPSDVQTIKPPQKEWNRTRQALREHRNANKPKYATPKGTLTVADKESLVNCAASSVIELESMQPGQDVGKILAPIVHSPIDPMVYDTTPLNQDMFTTLGNENATQPAAPDTTATASTINQESRLVVNASNIDDLDDLLTDIAEAGGEILFRECSIETIQRIAGPGAVWPQGADVEDFINFVQLEVVAASSGRPNKALEISNFVQMAPFLAAAGAPPYFMVREILKRLDDRLDVDEIFQLGPGQAMMPQQQQQASGGAPANPPRGTNAPSPDNQHPGQTQPKVNRPQQ